MPQRRVNWTEEAARALQEIAALGREARAEHADARDRQERALRAPALRDPLAPYDALGRKLLWHPPVWRLFEQAVPGFLAQFDRQVPHAFVTQVDDGVYAVACPCSAEPRIPAGEIVECRCERSFLATGAAVLVANSPAGEPPAPVDVDEDA